VAHERHLALVLDAHHAERSGVLFRDPENDAVRDLGFQLLRRHVGLVPAVRRDHAAIGLGGVVDYREHLRQVRRAALSDAGRSRGWAQAGSPAGVGNYSAGGRDLVHRNGGSCVEAMGDTAWLVWHTVIGIVRIMPRRSNSVDAGSGNVFADLGYADAKERTLKVQLAMEVNRLLKVRGTTQAETAATLGILQPHVSDLWRYRLDRFSAERLMGFLVALGRDVEIRIGSRPGRGGSSGVRVSHTS